MQFLGKNRSKPLLTGICLENKWLRKISISEYCQDVKSRLSSSNASWCIVVHRFEKEVSKRFLVLSHVGSRSEGRAMGLRLSKSLSQSGGSSSRNQGMNGVLLLRLGLANFARRILYWDRSTHHQRKQRALGTIPLFWENCIFLVNFQTMFCQPCEDFVQSL